MRTSHAVTAAVAALLLAGLVAARADVGPDPENSAAPQASTTTAGSPSAPGDQDAGSADPSSDRTATPPPSDTRTVAAAGIELEITARSVRIGPQGADGLRRITVTGTPHYATRTPGATIEENSDESITLLSDDAPVAALTPANDESRARSTRQPDDAENTAGTTSTRSTTTLTLGTDALDSATWAQRAGEGGRSLAVVPRPWVRGAGESTLDLLAAQLVAVAPEADSDTMRDQLTCHHIGAPDKASWNLEPWRPDSGLLGTIAARCNPTG